MSEILTLLFDEYTKGLEADGLNAESQRANLRYQQLCEQVGADMALDIWDTAVGEGAVMQEVYFQAGLKTGLTLALELFNL